MANSKQRRKNTKNQETSAAHGTIADARRSLRRAAGGGDKSMKVLVWGGAALVAFALLWALLAP